MNLQDIKDMQAGPELNALILIRLFHKKTEQYDFSMDSDERILRFAQDGVCIPDYSTDISAAWEVVEKVDIVEISKSYRSGGEWYWGVFVNGNYTYAKSVPEAICKAALLAVMDDE